MSAGWLAILAALPSLFSLCAAIVAAASLRRSAAALRRSQLNGKAIQEVHVRLDGRLGQLLSRTKELATAKELARIEKTLGTKVPDGGHKSDEPTTPHQ